MAEILASRLRDIRTSLPPSHRDAPFLQGIQLLTDSYLETRGELISLSGHIERPLKISLKTLGLSTRNQNSYLKNGIQTIEQAVNVFESNGMSPIRNVGRVAFDEINDKINLLIRHANPKIRRAIKKNLKALAEFRAVIPDSSLGFILAKIGITTIDDLLNLTADEINGLRQRGAISGFEVKGITNLVATLRPSSTPQAQTGSEVGESPLESASPPPAKK